MIPLKVELMFKSGRHRNLEIAWDETTGHPMPELVLSAGQVGLVTTDGAQVKWNAGHIDFIFIDGDIDKILSPNDEAEEIEEPKKEQCPQCQAEMWVEMIKTKEGPIWMGECPRCGGTIP